MSLTTLLLMASILGLVLGPVLLKGKDAPSRRGELLDGFALVTAGGLAALHLLPEAILTGGVVAILFAIAGGLSPLLIERSASRAGTSIEAIVLLAGLLPHAALESAALGVTAPEEAFGMGAAIAAHRLPVGLIVFSTFLHRFDATRAWIAISALIAATLGGFWAGDLLSFFFSDYANALLQALVGGALLHIVASHKLHDGACHDHNGENDALPGDCGFDDASPRDHRHDHSLKPAEPAPGVQSPEHETQLESTLSPRSNAWSGLGALIGVAVVTTALASSSEGHHHDHIATFGFADAFMTLLSLTAPALLLAYGLVSLVAFVAPQARLILLSSNTTGQSYKDVLARFGSATSPHQGSGDSLFWLLIASGIGIECLLLSVVLLGPELTALRAMGALLIGLSSAAFLTRNRKTHPDENQTSKDTDPLLKRLIDGLHFGFVTLFDRSFPWIGAGLVAAAWFEPMWQHSIPAATPAAVQVVCFSLLGFPLLWHAAAITPLVALSVHKGFSAGAGIAFLITASILDRNRCGVLAATQGMAKAVAFGTIVLCVALGIGLSIDMLEWRVLEQLPHSEKEHDDVFESIWLGAICLLAAASVLRIGPRGFLERLAPGGAHSHTHS
jgi:uncharacterized protein